LAMLRALFPNAIFKSRNTTTKSNMYLEKPTYQQIHCHNHPEQTKAKTITKTSQQFHQKSLPR